MELLGCSPWATSSQVTRAGPLAISQTSGFRISRGACGVQGLFKEAGVGTRTFPGLPVCRSTKGLKSWAFQKLRVGEEAIGSLKREHLWVSGASGVSGRIQAPASGRIFPHKFSCSPVSNSEF